MNKALAGLILVSFFLAVPVSGTHGGEWEDILKKASGQTVYFNAWGGSQPVNDYIGWAAGTVFDRYQVKVIHVKVMDIAAVVGRILVEKSAGKAENGSVDLMWINGENFRTMKAHHLLFGPFSQKLPHYPLVDVENKPATVFDFTVSVDHMESPWGMAQLVFMADTARVESLPRDMPGLLAFARKHPGRFTYPGIPGFHGTTFVKQALLELADDPSILSRPVSGVDFDAVTRPLWAYLDALHPLMWRRGGTFPDSASKMISLLNDNEIFISLSFNPYEAANAIANRELPETVRTYVHRTGTIGNAHFVAIPFNSSAREGAMVFADFLLSPEAQARKSDPRVWGDPTVLAVEKLSASQRQWFDAIEKSVGSPSPDDLKKVLPEPHVSWVDALEKAWLDRYHR